ncbi:MAG: ester cyclase [Verrucomicrobiota bacterium]
MHKDDVYQFAQELMQAVWIPFNPSRLADFYHLDVVGHHRNQTLSLADIENRLLWDRANIVDSHYDIKDVVADTDRFSIRFLYTATLTKSGENLSVDVVYFYSMRESKIDKFWTLASIDFDYNEKP